MAYATSYWINYRSTLAPASFPGDNATYDVPCLSTDTYPASGKSLAGVYPFGSVGSPDTANSAPNLRHAGGRHSKTSGSDFERIGSLVNGRTYRLRGLFGFIGLTGSVGVSISKDTGFTLINGFTEINANSILGTDCVDIRGNVYSSYALWEAAQDSSSAYLDYTVNTTTDIYIGRSNTNFAGYQVAGFGIEDLSISTTASSRPTLLGVGKR